MAVGGIFFAIGQNSVFIACSTIFEKFIAKFSVVWSIYDINNKFIEIRTCIRLHTKITCVVPTQK